MTMNDNCNIYFWNYKTELVALFNLSILLVNVLSSTVADELRIVDVELLLSNYYCLRVS